MRKLLGVCVLVLGVGVALAEKPGPTGHLSDAGKYSVVFPAKPTKPDGEKQLATAGGNLTVFTAKYDTTDAVYSVTWTDYPESFKEVNAVDLLNGVVKGMTGADGKAEDVQPFDVSGGTGRSVTITVKESGNMVRAKLYLTGRRLYLVQVSGKKDAAKGKVADDFLASFNLLK